MGVSTISVSKVVSAIGFVASLLALMMLVAPPEAIGALVLGNPGGDDCCGTSGASSISSGGGPLHGPCCPCCPHGCASCLADCCGQVALIDLPVAAPNLLGPTGRFHATLIGPRLRVACRTFFHPPRPAPTCR